MGPHEGVETKRESGIIFFAIGLLVRAKLKQDSSDAPLQFGTAKVKPVVDQLSPSAVQPNLPLLNLLSRYLASCWASAGKG